MATIVIKDKNLVPQNIKRGVTILKVTGTLDASGGGSVNLQEKTVNSSTVSQNVTPGQGYDGLSKVTVNPYTLDSKTVDASTVSQTVTSDEDGLSSVTVNPYTLDSKTVDPSTSQITVNSSADGLSSVTVTAVTSSIDGNIQAGNIKKDVTILGVTGTYESTPVQPVLQDVSVSYSQNGEYTLSASSGYDGLGTVDISVNVASQGGDPWYIQAKKGEIQDVSNCSFGDLVNYDNGAAYLLSGTGITTMPILPDTSVSHANTFLGTFSNCESLTGRVDISINSGGSYAFAHSFENSSISDVSIRLYGGDYDATFVQTFINCRNIHEITIDGSVLGDNSGEDINIFSQAFSGVNNTWTGIIEDMNKADITINAVEILNSGIFVQAFETAIIGTLSIPNATVIHPYAFAGALLQTYVEKLVSTPNLFYNSNEDYWGPITGEAWGLTNIEINANATESMYFRWQDRLVPPSVYNILTHLDLTVSGKEVVFFGGNYWDDEAGEEVWKNLTVYDYPDGRIQTAYDAATTAGWTITNLTIVPTTSLNYVTTNRTDTTTIEIPGVRTTDTMMQASGLLNSSGNDIYDRRYIESKNHSNSGTSLFVYFRYGSNEIDLSLGKLNGGNNGDNVYVNGIDFSQVVDSTFGLIKVGNARRAYISSGGNQSTYNADSTFEVDNTDKLVLKMANWYGIKQWEGWDDTSTGGSSKVLVHDYVPVSVTESGTTQYGLFDQVTGVFYTNTGITGA